MIIFSSEDMIGAKGVIYILSDANGKHNIFASVP